MLPMNCPKCSQDDHRATSTNSKLADQIMRRRVCQACGHKWYTVELVVPDYAAGWSAGHARKPVLRTPLELQAAHTRLRVSHVEAGDQIAGLRRANERRSRQADCGM